MKPNFYVAAQFLWNQPRFHDVSYETNADSMSSFLKTLLQVPPVRYWANPSPSSVAQQNRWRFQSKLLALKADVEGYVYMQ